MDSTQAQACLRARKMFYSSIALTGFDQPEAYDRYRPSYNQNAVNELLSGLQILGSPGVRILEIGAGTGKLTEILAASEMKYDIIAVEPHEIMRTFLAKKNLPRVVVKDGLAQMLPVEDGTVDAAVVAQAFHWYTSSKAPMLPKELSASPKSILTITNRFADAAAVQEIHRVLKPNSHLGLIWNMEDFNSTRSLLSTSKWEAQICDIIWSLDDGQPRFKSERWQAVFYRQINGKYLFDIPITMKVSKEENWITPEDFWHRIETYCMLRNSNFDGKEQIRKMVFGVLERGEGMKKDSQGRIRMLNSVVIAWTRKCG